ncbi:unnamed protein product (mitochondrion) [Plasmodiophora brassicae]|uniref:Uncharacterized protein n=1 Tax=Plasmodiophora brassicae TaxID=37360 RepID=A0A3P3YID1_PLABS|nr:unnamed protein product [Plasmodiophora brassicae]
MGTNGDLDMETLKSLFTPDELDGLMQRARAQGDSVADANDADDYFLQMIRGANRKSSVSQGTPVTASERRPSVQAPGSAPSRRGKPVARAVKHTRTTSCARLPSQTAHPVGKHRTVLSNSGTIEETRRAVKRLSLKPTATKDPFREWMEKREEKQRAAAAVARAKRRPGLGRRMSSRTPSGTFSAPVPQKTHRHVVRMTSLERAELQQQKECTFKPKASQAAARLERDAFLAQVERDLRRRKEKLEKHHAAIASNIASLFHPEISPYSSSLQLQQPVHERLHQCWGARLRMRLMQEERIREEVEATRWHESHLNVSRTPDQVGADLHADATNRLLRRARLVHRLIDDERGSAFHVSRISQSFATRQLQRELQEQLTADGGTDNDDDPVSRDRATTILSRLGFLSSSNPASPNEAACLQHVFGVLDPEARGSTTVHALRALITKLSSDHDTDDKLQQLRFARIARRHRRVAQAAAIAARLRPPVDPKRWARLESGQLLQKSSKVQKKIADLKAERERVEAEQCTFKPVMRKLPRSLTANPRKRFLQRMQTERLCDLLHDDFRTKQARLEDLARRKKDAADTEFRKLTAWRPTANRIPASVKAQVDLPKGYYSCVKRLRNADRIRDAADRRRAEKLLAIPDDVRQYHQNHAVYYSKQTQRQRSRKVICYVSVQITPQCNRKITLCAGDDPIEIARNFCAANRMQKWAQRDLEAVLIREMAMARINSINEGEQGAQDTAGPEHPGPDLPTSIEELAQVQIEDL